MSLYTAAINGLAGSPRFRIHISNPLAYIPPGGANSPVTPVNRTDLKLTVPSIDFHKTLPGMFWMNSE
uniref:Uncharacterized protein n=1 Tax=viral metagenome TaxID=1070528 RepID=A0A6M3JDT7_9ZZZZ